MRYHPPRDRAKGPPFNPSQEPSEPFKTERLAQECGGNVHSLHDARVRAYQATWEMDWLTDGPRAVGTYALGAKPFVWRDEADIPPRGCNVSLEALDDDGPGTA